MKKNESKKEESVEVKIARDGMVSCGKYAAGKTYTVTKAEASFLVDVKGFIIVKQEK